MRTTTLASGVRSSVRSAITVPIVMRAIVLEHLQVTAHARGVAAVIRRPDTALGADVEAGAERAGLLHAHPDVVGEAEPQRGVGRLDAPGLVIVGRDVPARALGPLEGAPEQDLGRMHLGI